ncbi:membrane protein [Planotetraspora thailandica]|uniref:Membrane protein n=1 Tax=Planotetraspora thailandica TaxID=487172 RepID=A0A8J3XVH3_9ACTN|nr:DUF2752 domain-containing protein [Planotetraspora thailandica]GII54005.1 membrane protein [Planotetraspora thailandica]
MTGLRARGRARSMLAPLGVAAPLAAGAVLVALVDPNQPGHYPVCPLYLLTGLYCPGCGGLRAVHDLAHGDLYGAAGMNPLVLVAIPFAVFWWGRWVLRAWQGRPTPMGKVRPGVLYGLLVIAVVFGVARNLPFGHFLAP